VLKIGRLIGEVADSSVVIIDDLISTGGPLLGAARACKEAGARRVVAAAAHGVFSAKADELLAAEELDRVLVTDSIDPLRLSPRPARSQGHGTERDDAFRFGNQAHARGRFPPDFARRLRTPV
jgi:ribose-phosphate pyrophosphokinase